jgi:hypothetical protein
MTTRIRVVLLGALFCVLCFELGERSLLPGANTFVARVEAIIGRPLTPVSVAGVARRSARRCEDYC